MKRLVIDDCRTMNFLDAVYARTNEEAIELLKHHWDEIWWDWDAGYRFGVLEEESTFRPTLLYLEEANYFYDLTPEDHAGTKMVIHTSNPAGRKELDTVLSKWYHVTHVDAGEYTVAIDGKCLEHLL